MSTPYFAQNTETTSFKTRTSVLVECDFCEERNERLDEVGLIRLQHTGGDRAMIQTLKKKLSVKEQKTLSVLNDRGRYESVVLDIPLGLYYTRITLPYSVIRNPQICEAWDTNPIEEATVFNIPRGADLGLDRVERAGCLTLGFACGYSDMLETLLKVKWRVCKMKIAGVEMNDTQLANVKRRTRLNDLRSC